MGIVRVERCCCFNLETGVTIMGYFSLVIGILSLIGGGLSVGGKSSPLAIDGIISGLLCAIIGACLIFGVRKSNPNFLIAYLVVAGIGIIKTVIQIIYWIGMLIGGGRKVDTGDTVAKIIGSLIFGALITYFWIVVYSLYKKLKEGTSIRTTSNAA